ncbi:MAG: hypothetical protein JNL94_08440 [Planctomycetes bacterium]|nr:hypothetical protein [Planctomycetota bacterium]
MVHALSHRRSSVEDRVSADGIVLRTRLAHNFAGYGAEARLASRTIGVGHESDHLGASLSLTLESIEDELAVHRWKLERDDIRFDRMPTIAEMTTTLSTIVREAYPGGEVVPVNLEHIMMPPVGWVRVGGRRTLPLPAVGAVIALHENDGHGGPGAPIGFTSTAGDGGLVQISALLVLRP